MSIIQSLWVSEHFYQAKLLFWDFNLKDSDVASHLQVWLSQQAVQLFGLFRATLQRPDVNQQLHRQENPTFKKKIKGPNEREQQNIIKRNKPEVKVLKRSPELVLENLSGNSEDTRKPEKENELNLKT